MRLEADLGIGEVAVLEVGGKVPEAAVVRFADEGDAADEGLGRLGRAGDARAEREAVHILRTGPE